MGWRAPREPTRALVLGGGGARAAFQAGVLRYIGEAFPEADLPVLTGVSAGAINAAHLANRADAFPSAGGRLVESWKALTADDVFAADSRLALLLRLVPRLRGDDGSGEEEALRALFDTAPLRTFLQEHLQAPGGVLTGVARNLERERLRAVAITTTNYATGQTVNWVQGDGIEPWERSNRISLRATLTVEHVMASTALPLLFPAVQIGEAWFGDGGLRLAAPLAPAIHLGADRLLIISTRYDRSRAEADDPAVQGYPPAAQMVGMLMNAVFLDVFDQDVRTAEMISRLTRELPPHRRHGLRPVELLQIRPSKDLGRLAGAYDAAPPPPFGMLAHLLDSEQTRSPDWLSMLLFEEAYVARLIDLGYHDARREHEALAAFFEE